MGAETFKFIILNTNNGRTMIIITLDTNNSEYSIYDKQQDIFNIHIYDLHICLNL